MFISRHSLRNCNFSFLPPTFDSSFFSQKQHFPSSFSQHVIQNPFVRSEMECLVTQNAQERVQFSCCTSIFTDGVKDQKWYWRDFKFEIKCKQNNWPSQLLSKNWHHSGALWPDDGQKNSSFFFFKNFDFTTIFWNLFMSPSNFSISLAILDKNFRFQIVAFLKMTRLDF